MYNYKIKTSFLALRCRSKDLALNCNFFIVLIVASKRNASIGLHSISTAIAVLIQTLGNLFTLNPQISRYIIRVISYFVLEAKIFQKEAEFL